VAIADAMARTRYVVYPVMEPPTTAPTIAEVALIRAIVRFEVPPSAPPDGSTPTGATRLCLGQSSGWSQRERFGSTRTAGGSRSRQSHTSLR
jgi:hypothetical protein